MRISVIDAWRDKKFTRGMVDYWRKQGHEVHLDMYWGPKNVEGFDVVYFFPVQDNLSKASHKQEKPKDTFIIAEAVDIDIYSNHPGSVNWSFVDALVFMSKHMQEYANEKFGKKFGAIPQYIIPGGVDLDKFTFRKDPVNNYNVAWIGRLWIAKNVFGALQIFNQLIKLRSWEPWRLYIRGDKYHPPHWWRRHVESYLDVNPDLKTRVEFTPPAKDMNEWLEDKAFLLQTSFKEAQSYVCLEAAVKGLKPIIQMTTGMLDLYPQNWIFMTHDEAIRMILGEYNPTDYRKFIVENYSIEKRVESFERIWGQFK